MTTEVVIFVFIAALLGGVANALLGWAKQTPPENFDWRKFITTLLTSIIGAAVITAGYNYSGVSNALIEYIGAFLAGAGVASGVTNVSGAIAARAAKLTK